MSDSRWILGPVSARLDLVKTATRLALLDPESCYRAVQEQGPALRRGLLHRGPHDGDLLPTQLPGPDTGTAATSPSTRRPRPRSRPGYRACKRCLPDATPGSPDWDVAADVAGRAMRLISDGLVDREGVEGLARRIGYTPRHLGRLLTQELGAPPLALARARRAQTARVLIETSEMSLTDVAFAAGFSSVRQFNETVREVYALSPTELRGRRTRSVARGAVTMRLAVRTPFAGRRLLDFLAYHLVPGVEVAGPGWYARTLDLPARPRHRAPRARRLAAAGETAFVTADFALHDLRDTSAAVERVRRLLDADCDPVAVDDHLADDPVIGRLGTGHPRAAGAGAGRRGRDRRCAPSSASRSA